MKPTRYSGPVKTPYKSPQTIMGMKKSSFLAPFPPVGPCDLLSRHMQAHYKRIAEAKGRADTSVPKSLLKCTKVLDQARKKALSSSPQFSRHPSRTSLKPLSLASTKRSESDAGFASMTASVESLHIMDKWIEDRDTLQMTMPSHSRGETEGLEAGDRWPLCRKSTYKELLDLPTEQDQRWQLYHTRTGQETGHMLQERKGTSPARSRSHSASPSPWKPAFCLSSPHLQTLPSFSGLGVQTPEDNAHWKREKRARTKSREGGRGPRTNTSGKPAESSGAEMDQQAYSVMGECDTATEHHREDKSIPRAETSPQSKDSYTLRAGASHTHEKGMDILRKTVEMSLHSEAIHKRSQEAKRRLEEKALESEYLQFVSGVTRDILSRGVLSDPALTLLFRTHVERNKGRLREDIMLEKIGTLRKQLGLG